MRTSLDSVTRLGGLAKPFRSRPAGKQTRNNHTDADKTRHQQIAAALRQNAKSDPSKVKSGRCQDKANSVSGDGYIIGHFSGMRVSVKQCEEADERHATPHREPSSDGDQKSEYDEGGRDALFDERNRHAAKTCRAADGHHSEETCRHKPSRPPAELRRPESDGDHRENMIKSGDGMEQSASQSAQAVVKGMSLQRSW